MKHQILALGLGIAAILLTAQGLHAQDASCGDRAVLVEQLAAQYGETRQSIGLSGSGQVIEVFASTETGSWTITTTLPTGVMCLVAAGEHFERLDEELNPAALGEPA